MVHAVVRSMVLRIRLRSRVWYRYDLDQWKMWSEIVRLLSKMTPSPRLRAESTGERMTTLGKWIVGWFSDKWVPEWRYGGRLELSVLHVRVRTLYWILSFTLSHGNEEIQVWERYGETWKFFELFRETNDEKFSFWRIERKKVRWHPIIDIRYSLHKVSNIVWEVSSREWYLELSVISVEFMTWRWIRYDFTERSSMKKE